MGSIIRSRITIILALFIVATTVSVMWQGSPSHLRAPSSEETLTPEDLKQEDFWREKLDTVGGESAYRAFVTAVSALPISSSQQHTYAHVFGGALYEELGDRGLAVCGSEFLFGCFHELIGRAIAQLGIGAVHDLNQQCIEVLGIRAPFCQHGIGHGIQTNFGYKKEDLDQALAVCAELPHNDPIGGCAGGIYMEYNFQTMLGDDAQVRQSDDPFAPCNSVPEGQKLGCSFWQPQWWWRVHFDNEVSSHAASTIGDLCREMGTLSIEHTEACFGGIGNIATFRTELDAEQSALLCDAAGADNTQYQMLCRAYAANRIANESGMLEGLRACEGLLGERYEFCSAFAKNEQYSLKQK